MFKRILLLISLPIIAYSQNQFKLYFDAARFCIDDSTGYIEIYYSFPYSEMNKKVVNSDTLINGSLSIKIITEKDSNVFVDKKWKFNQKINTEDSAIKSGSLTGALKFSLPMGKYVGEVKGIDENEPSNEDSLRFEFDIKPMLNDRFSLSDIELASNIKKVTGQQNSPFYKNNYEIIPNPGLTYGNMNPALYFYLEIYNLDKNTDSKFLEVEYSLIDQFDKRKYIKTKFVPTKYSSIVFANAINVKNFTTGQYQLRICVSDTIKNKNEIIKKMLFIYNPHIADSAGAVLNTEVFDSEYMAMNEEEIDENFAKLQYISKKNENDDWKRLASIAGKRNFLYNFWKIRDEDPNTPVNKFKNEYFKRINITNTKFSTMQRDGWKTDRGRVFCIYGRPGEVERYPNEPGTKPYEIWTYYDIEGGAIFIFVDFYGLKDLKLIHSTKQGELYDQNWERKIKTF